MLAAKPAVCICLKDTCPRVDLQSCELFSQGSVLLQVRCIAAVLSMVGKGLEQPSIVATLLDIQRTPAKPQYTLANEVRLHQIWGPIRRLCSQSLTVTSTECW